MARSGPIDDFEWADKLEARVLTPGGERLHGYDIEGDLAPNYSFAETLLTALTGSAPARELGRAFEIALSFTTALSPGLMPAHAGGVSRLMGAAPAAVLATTCLGLSEYARVLIEDHAPLIAWLTEPEGPAPRVEASSEVDRDSVARLELALGGTKLSPPLLRDDPTRMAALISVFHACGLVRSEQLMAAIVVGGLGSSVAEALAVRPLNFPSYPLKVPNFRYVESGEGDEG